MFKQFAFYDNHLFAFLNRLSTVITFFVCSNRLIHAWLERGIPKFKKRLKTLEKSKF